MNATLSGAAMSPSAASQRAEIPGSYGWPVIGPLSERLQYFWLQGPQKFFANRMEKYESTVFRTNVPPTFPVFVGVNPNVVAVLDVKSFRHLFDTELVDKTNILVGDFMPSVKYTGGIRVCAYLDTTEAKHVQIKSFAIDILKRSSSKWVSSMVTTLDATWDSLESQLTAAGDGGSASYILPLQEFLFAFLSLTLLGADASAFPEIKKWGHIYLDLWLGVQLVPTISINVAQPLEEIFLHSFSYPFWLVKSSYEKLTRFVENGAAETVARAQTEFNLTKEEAIHNLLFTLGFNAFGGFTLFFLSLLGRLSESANVHKELRREVREKLSNNVLSFETVKEMDLVNSFVYETLRLDPPVPQQFGRARKDFNLTSHNAVYEIKKGELLCGFQPLVMRDPKIFENPEDFVYNRFSKENGGNKLLEYLFWSNGPQTGTPGPSASNKQCAAKDAVPQTAAVFLAYLFQRYDEISISSGSITALKRVK
ncbi:fatty acid hydroperoxide lyase, chloroplastic-like [Salvia splendens]|uniref:fatty acid hydroperoxide lyase, chloroplastic-like n=1 Tax=Salvia splendens TaxID=180675 RepID=UPI001C2675E9|nr:fatty acid hydroperoxide lyase, chloroplastic-like [Salvia splendens]